MYTVTKQHPASPHAFIADSLFHTILWVEQNGEDPRDHGLPDFEPLYKHVMQLRQIPGQYVFTMREINEEEIPF